MTKQAVWIGIDVSKGRLDVAASPGADRVSVATDELQRLVSWVGKRRPQLIVLEATGGYEREAVAALAAKGWAVAVVNPRQVRDYARATGRLAKTDAIDAGVLASFAEAVRPEPRRLRDAETEALRDLVVRRRQLLDTAQPQGSHQPWISGRGVSPVGMTSEGGTPGCRSCFSRFCWRRASRCATCGCCGTSPRAASTRWRSGGPIGSGSRTTSPIS